jgi:hypothetical protein
MHRIGGMGLPLRLWLYLHEVWGRLQSHGEVFFIKGALGQGAVYTSLSPFLPDWRGSERSCPTCLPKKTRPFGCN